MKLRVWSMRRLKWIPNFFVNEELTVFEETPNGYEAMKEGDYKVSLSSTQKDTDNNLISEGDIVELTGDERKYLVDFTGTEFILRDVTSENPKYDDDIDHDYGDAHDDLLSMYRFSPKIRVVGNRFENLHLILNS